jgi:hypothetical protein
LLCPVEYCLVCRGFHLIRLLKSLSGIGIFLCFILSRSLSLGKLLLVFHATPILEPFLWILWYRSLIFGVWFGFTLCKSH